ncbi:hypothetical protein MMC11_006302 [Xylographa trunciseda]|nr:hypothetical protein [Xylographa trunciseda]
MTTTAAAVTPTTTSGTPTGTPTGDYVIVSPSSCPPSKPTGALIGQSDQTFSDANGGLQYQQFSNSQFIIQNASIGPFFVDLSSPDSVAMSDANGDTLILYANGTFEAFAGACELDIVGTLPVPSSKSKAKRNTLEMRQSAELCNDVQLFCNSRIGVFLEGAAGGALCLLLGGEIGADVGGAIGFLGNALGPEVGIPTTLLGVFLGSRLGAFLASDIGAVLCSGATSLLADQLCKACPTILTIAVNVAMCVLPEYAKMASALLQPAMDQHAVASTAAARTASALRHLTALDSAVLISPATLSQTALLALTVLKGKSALLALAVGETCV